ncbi:MAG: nikE, partial [Rhizobacter sp.]|nr:nikE [Rhizobacter sp.]
MRLSVENLRVRFRRARSEAAAASRSGTGSAAGSADDNFVEAVGRGDVGVSFEVPENTTLALVGESGSGKTVTAMSILDLLPDNAERLGRIVFEGRDLLTASRAELRALRGREIACVFQDPMSSLNPVMSIGRQLCEPLSVHLGLSGRAMRDRAAALLDEVGLPDAKRRLGDYPHQLSGGQQQRVMIAMALACEPRLLIADEPTTALDVTIQRQIIELLATLKARHRMSMLFISHDLGVVGEIADQVVVMRDGTVRERGPVSRIFAAPQDPYTRALLACRPTLDMQARRLVSIDAYMAAERAEGDPQAGSAPVVARAGKDADAPVLLDVTALTKSFWIRRGFFGRTEFKAVGRDEKGVSFRLRRGHTLG